MKLSKTLFSSGVLGRGDVRHCADWDFRDLHQVCRTVRSATLRKAAARRSRGAPSRSAGLLARLGVFRQK